MSQRKIVHLTSVHGPFDTRIFYKECVSLRKAGYEVVLVAPHERSERVNGVRIHAVPKPASKKERLRRTVWQVYRAAVAENGALYHFHDPELIPVGMLLKLRGKKVVYDVHEDVPAQVLEKEYLNPVWIRRMISKGVNFSEWVSGIFFDGIVSVVPKVAARFPAHKSITVQNYPMREFIDRVRPIENVAQTSPVVIYAGGLMRVRSIVEIVKAMDRVGGRAELWLLGEWESDALRRECEQSPGWRNVRYLGFKTLEDTYGYLKIADLGLVIFYPLTNHLIASPNKAFEYMACALPMVMSDFPYWRNVYEGAALFVDPKNPKDIATAILRLLDHPEEAAELGENGYRAVLEKYNWAHESQKLLALYEEILA
ncbi:MAG: glycosyltransferase family 4 protein [Chloroflexi bacterium]|nr:glycosyltransferase family 4 protein [Chloroflexota bacterium]